MSALNRRHFLKVNLAMFATAAVAVPRMGAIALPSATEPNALSPFIRVFEDGKVELLIPCQEMGQGVRTSLAMLLAEELDVSLDTVSITQAPAHASKYGRQETGGSGSVRRQWRPLRMAGAAAREMLCRAAADTWKVPLGECMAKDGVVRHEATSRAIKYGELVKLAATYEAPTEPQLKPSSKHQLIRMPIGNLDNLDIVTGSARFGADIVMQDMLFASIVRSPTQKGKVAQFNDAAAMALAGIVDIYKEPSISLLAVPHTREGVVILGRDNWTLLKARKELEVEWRSGDLHHAGAQELKAALLHRLEKPGVVVHATEAWEGLSGDLVDRTYYTPMQYQAQMEPMVCTALVNEDSCFIWAPIQWPQQALQSVARFLEMPEDKITIQPTRIGGSFGRKYSDDFIIECVAIARRFAGQPIQLQWTREDDIGAGGPQVPNMHRLQAKMSADNRPTAWYHRWMQASPETDIVTADAWQPGHGQRDMPYRIPHIRCEFDVIPFDMFTTAHRAVFHPTNSCEVNSFMDELAFEAEEDPIAYHLELLGAQRILITEEWQNDIPEDFKFDTGRLGAVVQRVREISGWKGRWLANGGGRGFAVHRAMLSYVAVVVDLHVEAGDIVIDRVFCAVDCGKVVNPLGAKAQIEGSIIWGISTALYEEMTLFEGIAGQQNFDAYEIMSVRNVPSIEIAFIEDDRLPIGLGEPVVPTMIPAVANAVFAATGERVRALPIMKNIQQAL